MFEALKICLSETMELLIMKIFLYTGFFNWAIIIAVFVIKGTISFELVMKMRKLIFYAFVITSVPFAVAFIKYLNQY
ncbi:MAG: hypothetical protein LHV68_11390 [Elusimicrobia bacterium]|nr:hypothetical protein [Candidatus Liberimonas magnetica]